jgi:hypothetical protein
MLDKDGSYKATGPSISNNLIKLLHVKDKNLLFQNFLKKPINGFIAWGNYKDSMELQVC